MADGNFPTHGENDEEAELEFNSRVHDPGDPDGVVAAEKRLQWQERHPNPSTTTPAASPKPKRRWPVVAIVVLLLVGASVGAYLLGSHQASKKQGAENHATTTKPNSSPPPATTQTKHYDSTNFSLGFDYPADWTVSDTPAKLTVASPSMELMTAVGAKTNAHVVVAIQNQQSSIAGFPAGGAVASLASDLLVYKQPSPVQRAQTYLSYLSYTEPSGLDALYLTGDKGYQQAQSVPMSDIVLGNPLIGVGFVKCSSDTCAGGTSSPVTLKASSWKSSQAAQAVTNLIKSIVIRG